MSKNEVLKQETTRPAFLNKIQSVRGSEEVDTDDLVIPRLELAQSLSPCLIKEDPSYIPGIEKGDLFNNVTREIYGTDVVVCPVMFKKEYLLWRDRKNDIGGFYGAYGTLMEAEDVRNTLDRPENVEAVKTHQHLCLLVRDNGKVEEIAISMAKSKRRPSSFWNSLIRINDGDRFSRLYTVASVADKSDAGPFQNFKVSNFGFVNEDVFKAGAKLYDIIKLGNVTVNRSLEEASKNEGEEGSEY